MVGWDPPKDVIDYRMKVHLFGASSSPGCANFGLRRAADDGEEEFGTDAAAFIRKDFYVDDGLKSVSTVPNAIQLTKASQAICSKACLRLHKIASNKKEVLEAFPVDDHSKEIKELNLAVDPLPVERALGVMWCAESDSFRFRIELHDRPLTRRGVLSTIGSIYDPNGYLAPVTLRGKQILQQMCKDKLDWDSPVPEYLHPQWEKWRREIVWSIVYVYEVTKCSSRDCQFIGEFFLYKRIETFHESKRCCETTEVRPRDKFDWCTK